MTSNTSWDDFRLVRAIAEAKSLAGAADQLGINHSTVFRRLGALEKSLGARLFDRSRTGYTMTAAGQEMVALARRISEEINGFERGVAGRDVKPAGVLRVTTNDTFVSHLLAPVFASFRTAYPDIVLDVIVTHQPLNLSRRDADVAIRATHQPPETLVGRKLSKFRWCVYAPRKWGLEGKPQDHGKRSWVGYGEALYSLPARKWLEASMPAEAVGCRFDTLIGVARAIQAGLGLGAIPCFIGDSIEEIERIGEVMEFGDALWLLTHADLRHSARVRAFMDHAAAELMRSKSLIEAR